ncbi:Uncharacterised protein [Mycobacteroides abscessus]|nr:Uncharacterised protein [Mycobacteroides abscessus]
MAASAVWTSPRPSTIWSTLSRNTVSPVLAYASATMDRKCPP